MSNKVRYIFPVLLLFSIIKVYSQDLPFFEGFEGGVRPDGWMEQKVVGDVSWKFQDGGYTNNPDPLTKKPPHAYDGFFNAMFQVEANGPKTRLITRPIDLEFGIKPLLTFWHAQYAWGGDTEFDKINVYYRSHVDSSWNLLLELDELAEGWEQEALFLPDSTLSGTYYLAFEGESNWGWGACIDNIEIIETGIIPKHLINIDYVEPELEFIANNTQNNPVYKIELKVYGNSGTFLFDSLYLESLNTSDADIDSVKIYWTKEKYFNQDHLVGKGNFDGGNAIFKDLGYDIPFGKSYLWLTYDTDSTAVEGDLVNFNIPENAMRFILDTAGVPIGGNLYFQNDTMFYLDQENNDTIKAPMETYAPQEAKTRMLSPVITSSVFYDSFETDKGWNLTGEFERDTAQGLGGILGGVSDPEYSSDGKYHLGTDISGLGGTPGDYEGGLTQSTAYLAESPVFDCKFYKDIDLSFDRWLNIETFDYDRAYIEFSTDNGATWQIIWNNYESINENNWSNQLIDLSKHGGDRSEFCKVRYRLGPTDLSGSRSGWNIDRFLISGDYVANDISISKLIAPGNGCGHTSADDVTIMVKNLGPTICKDTIPIFYSFYGGDSIVYDTIFNANLAPEDSMVFTFSQKIDLSRPGAYDLIIAADLPVDEYRINDTVHKSLFIQPTIDLPYAESFEINQGLWLTGGNENNTWEWGNPTGGAKDGLKAWVTKLGDNYKDLDSSWIESVCFSFDDTLPKIIDFYHKAYLQEGFDGAILEYSLDNGQIWNYVDTHNYAYEWNWYNDTILSFGGEKGWTQSKTNWTRERQVLPDILDEETQVKFRIHFSSDSSINKAGMYIDNFKIYKAPYDIGIVSIDSIESACQFVNPDQISVTVKNFGIRDMQPGDTILVGIDASRNSSMIDTLVLQGVLAVNDSVTLKLNKSINLDTAGMYDITAFTLIEDDPFFYSKTCNDTASLTFYVHPNPVTNLADTIKTARPDTLTIKAYYDPLYQYTWMPAGGANDSVYNVLTAGDIFLTITNSDSTACVTNDSINIHLLVPDLKVDSLMNPFSSCELDTAETVTIRIRNIGSDTLNIGDTIVLGYSFDAGLPVVDTFLMPTRFHPGDTMDFHIDKDSLDMSAFSTYSIKAYLDFAWDFVPDNDTLETTVITWGYPAVNLGSDVTIYTLEHVIDAGPGYSSYLWNTGDTTRYDTVTRIGDYHVIITDEHGCPNSDTVHVNFDYLDIGVTALIEPFDQCMPSDTLEITATITNTGTDTITNNTPLKFGYRINGGAVNVDNFTLTQDIYPDSSFQYTFTEKQFFDTPGDYLIDVFTLITGDINTANDTLYETLSFYPYPDLELGADTLVKAYEYTLDAGYDSTYTYLWNTGADTSAITITAPGDYTVTVTSSHGCYSTDERKVTIVVPDITVMDLNYPNTSCLPKNPVKMKVTLYNNGTDTAYAGETITMGYSVNGGDLTTEPYTLLANFLPNAVLVYEFTNAYEYNNAGNTEIAVFALVDDDINTTNDTLTETVVFYPYPEVELGNDTIVKSYEFVLDAGYDASYTYEWNTTGEDTSSITITSGGTYSVSVTSSNGCLTTDSRSVTLKVPDVEISQLLSPVTSCIPEGTVNVKINVHNNGSDTVLSGSTIKLGYQVDAFAPVEIDYVLTGDLLPNANLEYQFSKNEMFAVGSWGISSYVVMPGDINTSNDTLGKTFSYYEYPEVELGNDTLIKNISHTLVANNDPTYIYNWSTGGHDSTITVEENGTYRVTVTTSNGCSAFDEIALLFTFPNIGVVEMTEPTDLCGSDEKLIAVNIKNHGSDTLEIGDQIGVGYTVNGGAVNNEQLILTQRLLPKEVVNYSFESKANMSEAGDYTFKLFTAVPGDLEQTDDTLTRTLSILAEPVPKFMENAVNDTIKTALPTYLNAGSGFTTYSWDDGQTGFGRTINFPGWYGLTLIDFNGCSGYTIVYIAELDSVCDTCTYVDQLLDEQLLLDIYPNPASEVLYIDFEAQKPGRVTMQLFDAQGKAVLNKQTEIISQYREAINTFELPNGIYILRVIYNDKSKSYRIVKQ